MVVNTEWILHAVLTENWNLIWQKKDQRQMSAECDNKFFKWFVLPSLKPVWCACAFALRKTRSSLSSSTIAHSSQWPDELSIHCGCGYWCARSKSDANKRQTEKMLQAHHLPTADVYTDTSDSLHANAWSHAIHSPCTSARRRTHHHFIIANGCTWQWPSVRVQQTANWIT